MNKFANDNRAANELAASMDAILKDPVQQSMFSSSSILEKLAFKRVADEGKPSEIEVEITDALNIESLESTASDERADCVCCGKKRANWDESMGVCKCSSAGCNPVDGCKDDCSCGCKKKQASISGDSLIKSACDALLKVSADLDNAGFESLSVKALVLVNSLVVEAKAKKQDKNMAKDKEKAAKEKEKFLKAKEKEKADKEKAKLKAEKDKNMAKDKAMKEKLMKDKEKAKLKKSDK